VQLILKNSSVKST